MPRPKSDSRQKIIRSAQQLFRRYGYHVTGLAQIVQHSGTPRGSVYFLFPGGKEHIAVEAIGAWCAEVDELLRRSAATSPTAIDWFRTVAGHFESELRNSNCSEGLPLTTIILDSVPGSEVITAACRQAYQTWTATMGEVLCGYGVHPDRIEPLTNLLQASLEGAIVLCRLDGSTRPLEQLLPLIGALIPR